MRKSITIAAMVSAMTLATVPALTNAAFAQAAAPEPPQGAQPMDNGGAASGGKSSSMDKSSSMMKKSSKHMKKHKKSM